MRRGRDLRSVPCRRRERPVWRWPPRCFGRVRIEKESIMNMPIAKYRAHNQDHRIDNGVQSGELTRREARGLRQDQREIKAEMREARSDGVVTKSERQEIREMQNGASKDIFQAKHDEDK